MAAIAEPILRDIKATLGLFRFPSVHQIAEDKAVADVTEKYILQVGPSTSFILIISNPISPFMVRRNVDRMRMARALLSDGAEDPIELPLVEGGYEGRTYALWRRRQPLSSNRVVAKIQRTIITPSILRWVNDVASQTLHRGESAQAASFVERLSNVSSLPEHIKKLTAAARLSFLTGEITPLNVLQHGDLWIGNILRRPRQGTRFIIIDWAGSTPDGFPFFDLVKFASSIGATPIRLLQYMRRYSELIGCNLAMSIPYILAGLGRLHLELESFPEGQFIELCKQKIGALQSALRFI